MCFTGFTRFSSDVQNANMATQSEIIEHKKKMLELVDEDEWILIDKNRDLDDFGRLLDYTWQLKRQTGKSVSNDTIDRLYDRGIKAEALGGKLLGAGSGGFLVFYVQECNRKKVMKAMQDLLYIQFSFEDDGARVIHYGPETYVPVDEMG